MNSRRNSAYRYSERAGRYIDSRGRFVSAASVRAELDKSIDASARAMRELSDGLRAGRVSLAEWELAMMGEIRNSHLAASALAKGGWAQMTPADYGRAGRAIRTQYEYLREFAADIASGKQKLDGTLGRRTELYIKDARIHYHDIKRREAEIAGQTYVGSIRHARDSCEDCIRLNGRLFKIGDPAYIPVGRRRCRGNCLCTERYATEEEARAAA